MGVYLKHAKMHIKRAMEYRTSFILTVCVQVLMPFTCFLSVWFMFDRFGQVEGWPFRTVLLCYAVTYFSYGVAECFARGFDTFSRQIRTGNFDRLLLQPRSAFLLTACAEFELTRVGKMAFAAILLIYGAASSGISWTAQKILVLFLMLAGGALVFAGLFIAFAALCFVTIEGMEIANIFTDGGRELSSYPLDIYAKPVTQFFTFIVPLGAANYIPLQFLTGSAPTSFGLAPLISIPFFIFSILIFNAGVRKYRSTGS